MCVSKQNGNFSPMVRPQSLTDFNYFLKSIILCQGDVRISIWIDSGNKGL